MHLFWFCFISNIGVLAFAVTLDWSALSGFCSRLSEIESSRSMAMCFTDMLFFGFFLFFFCFFCFVFFFFFFFVFFMADLHIAWVQCSFGIDKP